MANRPEQQHIIPKFHQLNFCDSEGNMFVYDFEKSSSWRQTHPHNEFKEKNFQTLYDYEGLDPFVLEKSINKIETDAASAIRHIITNISLPPKEQFANVINLMGILGARNTVQREKINSIHKQISSKIIEIHLADEQRYNAWLDKYEKEGIITKRVPYEQAKKFYADQQFDIKSNHDEVVMTMLKGASVLIDLLAQRNWTILETIDAIFLSSDNPLVIIHEDPKFDGMPIGFGLNGTIVIFPLSSKFALIGSFDHLPVYKSVDKSVVEAINACIIHCGATKIFARDEIELLSIETATHLRNFYDTIKSV